MFNNVCFDDVCHVYDDNVCVMFNVYNMFVWPHVLYCTHVIMHIIYVNISHNNVILLLLLLL
jgi:hypothetical protein